ncbi:MAG: heavy-metal-associated domain-containing protein [Prolixibacteraceae bacterium]|jgi:mercuric ion binding protein|nr:heavy-metal-associated domain-containing protein [Prolixibacteraceae bacterium]
MKRLAFITTIALFTVSLLQTNAIAAGKKNKKTQTFIVSMDCQGCVNKIEDNIPYEKGVKDLKVSLDNKECTLTYRTDKTNSEKLIEAFQKLGYKAEIKKEKNEVKSQNIEQGVGEHEGHNHNMKH